MPLGRLLAYGFRFARWLRVASCHQEEHLPPASGSMARVRESARAVCRQRAALSGQQRANLIRLDLLQARTHPHAKLRLLFQAP